MPCCPDTKFSVFNQSVTNIAYSGAMRDQYGAYPRVEVLYWDGTNYVSRGVFTSIKFIGNPLENIVVDHGGPSIAQVKIY